jgi:hypothetical protein
MQIETITIKYRLREITLRIAFYPESNEGTIVSYEDRDRLYRAYIDAYDMKEITSQAQFNKLVAYYNKKKV